MKRLVSFSKQALFSKLKNEPKLENQTILLIRIMPLKPTWLLKNQHLSEVQSYDLGELFTLGATS